MKTIHFHEPPPAQRVGGLDAAISSIRAALEKMGLRVEMNPSSPEGATCAHFHGLWQMRFPALARQYAKRGLPYVVSPHGMLEPWAWMHRLWKKRIYWHLREKHWTRRAACVLSTSELESANLRRFFPQTRVESLPLGLTGSARPDYEAARAKLGWKKDETILLFLSRIHEKKGLKRLLRSLTVMEEISFAKTRLVIVGPEEQPEYAAHCRAFAEESAARLPRVEWRGAVWGDERWPYLQGADLFCLPSYSENFGLAVLEALQVGTPALTSDQTPWGTVLGEKQGYICDTYTAAVAAALRKFFENPTHGSREEISSWAWENYSWDVLAPRYAAFYSTLAKP